jgi:hypothetical protein
MDAIAAASYDPREERLRGAATVERGGDPTIFPVAAVGLGFG